MKKNPYNTFLGETLRKFRLQNKYSQDFVADCLNISRNAYQEWENGNIDFTISKLNRVCDLYNLHIRELLNKLPPPLNIILNIYKSLKLFFKNYF